MKRILYTRPDGGVSIVTPAPKRLQALMADMTETEALAAITAEVVPADARDLAVCDDTDIPTGDRIYRDAWRQNGAGVKVDMPSAREVHRARLRRARQGKLAALDGEWMKATGQANQTAADRIEAERQALRDLPQDPAIEAATTTDDLKRAWPITLDPA